MRATDHRYHHDQDKLSLAVTMIHLNARTCVIRKWTGLSGDRIRKLVKFYGTSKKERAIRHRGRFPSLSPIRSKNVITRQQTHVLGGLFANLGLAPQQEQPKSIAQWLAFGQSFCQTYEWFVQLEGESSISFEHALLLWRQLCNRTEFTLARCHRCQALQVIEVCQNDHLTCYVCQSQTNLKRSSSTTLTHARPKSVN